MVAQPTLGIALPVYDGQRFIREALDSLLNQSFADWELLIVDNASDDETPAIVEAYSDRDSRIRYHRNSENIGAARNFNLGFTLTSGRYFKWMAHDDLMHVDYLTRCIDALEADPGAVLAYSRAQVIDEDDQPLERYAPPFRTDAERPSVRFDSLLHDHKCFQIFGVIRRDALQQTGLIGLHAHGDGVLLAHLALLGRFVEIPELLFYPRKHAFHSSRYIGDYWAYTEWFDPSYARRHKFPQWRILREYASALMKTHLGMLERMRCVHALLRYVGRKWRLLRGDILFYVRPRLIALGVPARLLQRTRRARA